MSQVSKIAQNVFDFVFVFVFVIFFGNFFCHVMSSHHSDQTFSVRSSKIVKYILWVSLVRTKRQIEAEPVRRPTKTNIVINIAAVMFPSIKQRRIESL